MPSVFEFEVTPYYAQVAMINPANPNSYPEWETGEEKIVCGPSGVLVATRPDNFGVVNIGVWSGAYSPGPAWARLATVPIRASGRTFVVGSVTGSRLKEVQVMTGEHQLAVISTIPTTAQTRWSLRWIRPSWV